MLEELLDLHVEIDFNHTITTDQTRKVVVRLRHDGEMIDDGEGNFCAQLDDSVTITLGGRSGEITNRGGWYPWGTGWRCGHPILQLSIPNSVVASEATLVLRDDSLELRYPVGDVLAARDVTPLGRPGWEFSAGETTTFAWSPATDLNLASTAHVLGLGIAEHGATVDEDGIVVQFPSVTAQGTLRFVISGSIACGDHCSMHAYQIVERAAKIVP